MSVSKIHRLRFTLAFFAIALSALALPGARAFAADPAENSEEPDIVSEAEILSCGDPEPFDSKQLYLDLDPKLDYCDIFSRQLAYRKVAMLHTERLHARRAYYAAPGLQARRNYQEALDSLHEERAQTEREKNKKDKPAAQMAGAEETGTDSGTAEISTDSAGNVKISSNAAEAGLVKTAVTEAILKSVSE